MMVMVSNNGGAGMHYLAGRFPGRVGHLYSPAGWDAVKPRKWLPFALDNGAFTGFDEAAFFGMLDQIKLSGLKPRWVAVPDAVSDRGQTLSNWERYWRRCAEYGWPLAFVVQDGMKPEDVPEDAAVVFVGGSMIWKLRSLEEWAQRFDRVHVGRINTERLLWVCHDAGIESVDGTGWYHDKQFADLEKYLLTATEARKRQYQTAFD